MKLVVGGDHAGLPLKRLIVAHLSGAHRVDDVGTYDENPVDFPDVVLAACRKLGAGADRVILACGTGIGASMAANKIRGVRAALAHDSYSAHQSVEHDDANVLCIGAWIVGPSLALEIVDAFLAARWNRDDDVVRRVAKLHALEGASIDNQDNTA